jgi:PAS domain-containing protein
MSELVAIKNEILGYKKVLNESSIVAITDKFGLITFANDNFCKISKYTRGQVFTLLKKTGIKVKTI